MPDDIDLAIFHALEISPRASWAAVGAAVGVDPVTAARRWQSMQESHQAYVTSYPLLTRESTAAFIQIRCDADRVRAVATMIAHDPHAVCVDIVSGGNDLFVLAGAATAAALNAFVLDWLPALPGVTAVLAQPVVAVHAESGFEAPGLLRRSARELLKGDSRGTLLPSIGRVDDLDWQICLELARDGRAPVADIARAASASSSTIARRLGRLVAEGALHVRARLAPSAGARTTVVWLGIRVPPAAVSETVRGIARIAGVNHVSLVVADTHNLFVKVTFPHLAALEAFEARIHLTNPDIRVASRMVVLVRVRQLSRIFDDRGDATETVSIDYRRFPDPRHHDASARSIF